MLARIPSLLCITVVCFQLSAQPTKKDSLKTILASRTDALSFLELGILVRKEGKHDSALMLIGKASAYVTDDKKLEARIRLAYANTAFLKGYYSTAQQKAYQALEYYIQQNDSNRISAVYRTLGGIAIENQLLDKAIDFYEKALDFNPGEVDAENDLGTAFLENKKTVYKAISIYQGLLPRLITMNDSLKLAMAHNNLGDVFLVTGNYDSAFRHINATLKISIAREDSVGIMFDNNLLGRYYLATGQLQLAKNSFKTALRLSEKFGAIEAFWLTRELPQLYKNIIKIYVLEKKLDSVVLFTTELSSFQESELEKQKKNTSEFNLAASEEDFRTFLERERQNRSTLLQYFGITLGLLFLFPVYFLLVGRDSTRKYSAYLNSFILILSFEFIILLFDPFVTKFSQGNQLLVLLMNVVIAFLIIPAHKIVSGLLSRFSIDVKLKKMEQSGPDHND